MATAKLPEGITLRHRRECGTRAGKARCTCAPTYRVQMTTAGGTRIRRTFKSEHAARQERERILAGYEGGTSLTLREAAEDFIAGATATPPTRLNRSDQPYRPSVLRGYERDLRLHCLPELGGRRLSDIRRRDIVALRDRLRGQGLSASKVRNALMPLRVIFRDALEAEDVDTNPFLGVKLGPAGARRTRATDARETRELLAALPAGKVRAAYAIAAYAGLRRGEIRGLRWGDIDLANGVLRVERSMDDKAGVVEPKTSAGRRAVGIEPRLHVELAALTAGARGRDTDYVISGREASDPFTPTTLRKSAAAAFARENERRAADNRPPLNPVGLHELRRSYVSMAARAGVPLETIKDLVGHTTTSMTDSYRKGFADAPTLAARALAEYLDAEEGDRDEE